MLKALLIAGVIYVSALMLFSLRSRKKEADSKLYLLAGSNLGAFLGFFTFAATLFSTFTILGMPDFFRDHGVGAWVFLAVSDGVMVFGIMVIGLFLRRKALDNNFLGMSGLLERCYGNRSAGIIAFIGAFLFLIPYVAIQIRGVAIFLNQAFPDVLPLWVWALAMMGVMIIYSEIGGLKAIIYSDMLQGIILLLVIWIIAISCIRMVGGMDTMMAQVEAVNPALLSVPGPKGLFKFQFLISSMIAIALLPYTQPQVSSRLVIMRDHRAMFRMAVGVGFFAILVILPTAFIGFYGAIKYSGVPTSEFLGKALITDQAPVIAALALIGLIAAAISTADSQIFSLGGELRSLLKGEDKKMLNITRVAIGCFAAMALGFSLIANDQLVLLARTSFAGTSLMAPMIFTGLFAPEGKANKALPWITLAAIVYFVASLVHLVPDFWGGLRVDLGLLILLTFTAIGMRLAGKSAN